MNERKIEGGLYLVVDPSLALDVLLEKVRKAIAGGISILQIWNNWSPQQDKVAVVHAICGVAHAKNVPVLINEEWELLNTTELGGVHFDALPEDLDKIRKAVQRPFLCGITCGNDLLKIEWANKNRCDYVSFCSMFPSASAGVCEIVTKQTVQQARQMTSLPIFLAGGITLDNIQELSGTGMNGIALISGILKADDPRQAAETFNEKLKAIKKNETITS